MQVRVRVINDSIGFNVPFAEVVSSYYYICVLILLYMCPHTIIYMCSSYYICVLINDSIGFNVPFAEVVLAPLCIACPPDTTFPFLFLFFASCYYVYVLILRYMCPHTPICVFILLCLCPHATYMCLDTST